MEEKNTNIESKNTELKENETTVSPDETQKSTNPEKDKGYNQRTIFDALKEIEESEMDKVSDSLQNDTKEDIAEKWSDKEADIESNSDIQNSINKNEADKSAKDLKDNDEDLSKIDNRNDAEKALKSKGFDYAALYQEFLKTGDISEKSRKELEKEGITSDIIDSYIEGQKARVEASKNVYAEYVGGRKNLDTIVKWAEHNLSGSEINSINAITDTNIIKIILKELETRMVENEGKMPQYTKGEGGKSTKDIFHSQIEMFDAITDPKYRRDKNYRENVQKKISASIEAGIDLGI